MSTEVPPQSPPYFKWWVCVLLLLATTLNYMDRQALSVAGPRIKAHFTLSETQFGLLEGAFNIAFAVGALAIGWMVDRGNIRLIYPAIVVLWSLAGFATGFAWSFAFLLVCRFALGLFEAGNVPCGILTIKRVLRPEERALGNGMYQSGTALGAIITPLVVLACFKIVERSGPTDPGLAWRLPFWVVGAAGLLWAGIWLWTVQSHHVRAAAGAVPDPGDTYWAIWRNRRFWVALVVIVSINMTWRSWGFWLPSFLRQEKGYSEDWMAYLTATFFFAADLGSIAVGAAILALARRGMSLHWARVLCYAGCSGLTMMSVVAVLLPRGFGLVTVLAVLGFGALGLFPIYYALSQDISARHQGKVTGTLSFTNAICLAVLFPLQGRLVDASGSFALPLGFVGLVPVVGLAALLLWWKDAPKPPLAA
jgi:ACS family hexuronate transporter-like MFS transporter